MLRTSPPSRTETNSTDVLAGLHQLTSIGMDRLSHSLPIKQAHAAERVQQRRHGLPTTASLRHMQHYNFQYSFVTTSTNCMLVRQPPNSLPSSPAFFVLLLIRDTLKSISHRIKDDRKRTSRKHYFFLTL